MNCVVLRLMSDENKTFIFMTSRKHEFISRKLSISKPVLIWLRESLSQTKIAKGYGVGANAIKKLMDEYGIDTKSKPKFQKPSKEELLRLYPAKTLEEVGEHYIVGQTLVHKWFDEYGIESRELQKLVLICQKHVRIESLLNLRDEPWDV